MYTLELHLLIQGLTTAYVLEKALTKHSTENSGV